MLKHSLLSSEREKHPRLYAINEEAVFLKMIPEASTAGPVSFAGERIV